MARIWMTLNEDDQDLFEAGRNAVGMSQSAYLRLLISEHEQCVPSFIKYKDIISEFSELNNLIKTLVVPNKNIMPEDKLLILEKFNSLDNKIMRLIG